MKVLLNDFITNVIEKHIRKFYLKLDFLYACIEPSNKSFSNTFALYRILSIHFSYLIHILYMLLFG